MTTKTKIDTFTSSGTWVCPAGVTGILALLVGGGGGAPGNHAGGTNPSVGIGGAGSGEILIGVPMVVVPGNSYTVTVGAGGLGSAKDVHPPAAGNSSFNGFCAYGAPGYPPSFGIQAETSGAGGGWGGNEGFSNGGYPNPGIPANCLSPSHTMGGKGKRECRWGTGGNRGGMGVIGSIISTAETADATELSNTDSSVVGGVLGGPHPWTGAKDTVYPTYGGGGPGAGTIFGGNVGCDPTVYVANANSSRYGSGAPGGGGTAGAVHPEVSGGNGAPGIVQIMYIG